jgi:hypothetical protein
MEVASRLAVRVVLQGIVGRTVHGNSALVLMRTGTPQQQTARYCVLKLEVPCAFESDQMFFFCRNQVRG